jgi:hypothetical protein
MGMYLEASIEFLLSVWVLCATTEGERLGFMLQKLKEDLEVCSPRTTRDISLSFAETLRLVEVALLSPAVKECQLFAVILPAMEERTVGRISPFESQFAYVPIGCYEKQQVLLSKLCLHKTSSSSRFVEPSIPRSLLLYP